MYPRVMGTFACFIFKLNVLVSLLSKLCYTNTATWTCVGHEIFCSSKSGENTLFQSLVVYNQRIKFLSYEAIFLTYSVYCKYIARAQTQV
jgi:hypothetical protein